MPKPLAVQLYTFRDPARFGGSGMGLDHETLTALAEIGFAGVETVDVPGGDVADARRTLADLGLTVTSSHTWAGIDDLDAFERAAAALAEFGSPSIIVSHDGFGSVEAIDRYAERLNAAARIATGHGLRLGHHNHDQEARVVDGRPAYARLRDAVDPTVVFQVDIFWVVVGGAEPAAVIDDLGERVVSLHIKDGVTLPSRAYGAEPFVNVPVGEGIVDLAGAVASADAQPGIGWLIVEFDHVDGPPIEAVRRSFENVTARGLGRAR